MTKVAPPDNLSVQQVIEHMLESVVITDARQIILAVNPAFSKVTGYDPEDVIGKTPRMLKSGRHKPPFYEKLWQSVNEHGYWSGEITNRRKDGELYTEWLTISAIKNRDNKILNYMAVFTDITERVKAQETIKHMAYFDALTNLPNRAFFRERLSHDLANAKRRGELLGVLFLDLDRVKIVNDTLGHDMGDRLLIGVGERLKSVLRETDTLARLGGDEFMVLLPGLLHLDEITAITEKVLEAIHPPFQFGEHEIYTTVSIGISIYPYDGNEAETLLKNADTAMYRAKRHGRNTYQIFDQAMKNEMLQQLTLNNGLRRALEREEFVVHYQPQINIRNGEIVGVEALVRWQHPEFGLVHPTSFIHWAEDSGLIVPIGEWVLQAACRQNKKWMEAGYNPIRVGVNLSARQCKEPNIVAVVAKTLSDSGLPPNCLELELTESVAMEMGGPTVNIPYELKAMGVGFSIDDFGTGYSSLNYLKRLPVNTLKMDQSFVRDLTVNPNDAAIATAVIALGHGLNLTVLAEGVETEAQMEYLKNLNCDRMQGFLFSKPLPANEFEELLKTKHAFAEESLFRPLLS